MKPILKKSAKVDKKERAAHTQKTMYAHLDNVYEAECLDTDAITQIQKKTPKDRSRGEECSLILTYVKNTYRPLVVDAYIKKRRESGFEPKKTDPFWIKRHKDDLVFGAKCANPLIRELY